MLFCNLGLQLFFQSLQCRIALYFLHLWGRCWLCFISNYLFSRTDHYWLLLYVSETFDALTVFKLIYSKQALTLLRMLLYPRCVVFTLALFRMRDNISLSNQEILTRHLYQVRCWLLVLSRFPLSVLFWVLASFLLNGVATLHNCLKLLLLLQKGLKLI